MDSVKDETEEAKKLHDSTQRSVEASDSIEPLKEMNTAGGGDIDSTHSDGTKTLETREERIKRLKEKSEADRQRKYTEILESQKLSNELRQRQQEDRRKKIEELKQREEERKKKVEQRRLEVDAKEKEKNEGMLRRTMEREARAVVLQRQIRTAALMTQSMSSHNQARMTTSTQSARVGTHSVSDKCTKVYNRSFSGFAVDRVSRYVERTGCRNAHSLKSGSSARPSQTLARNTEVVHANVRHAGCFVAFKGPQGCRVKGVLAWGPAPDRPGARGSSVAWWAGIGDHQHPRATSAHVSLPGPRGRNYLSSSHNLQNVTFEDNTAVHSPHTNDTPDSNTAPTVTMTPEKSHNYLRSSARNIDKEPLSPRLKNRSISRPKTEAAAPNHATNRSNPRTQSTSSRDPSLYDRLSKPRGGSQPPKTRAKEPLDSVHKNMSCSFTKQPVKACTRMPPATKSSSPKKPAKIAKTGRETRKSLPISTHDLGLTSCPASEMEPAKDVTELAITEQMPNKSSPRRSIKLNNMQGKEGDHSGLSENSCETKSVTVVNEEDVYRLKLTEQRRLAREAKEKQLEEQRRVDEEARQGAVEERKRMKEETRQMVEEEAKRARQLEEDEMLELARLREEEHTDRLKKEESEREIEEKRVEKLRLDDCDRMERKRRLEKIMSRVKKADESSSLSNDESGPAMSEVLDQEAAGDQAVTQMPHISLDENGAGAQIEDASCEPMVAWAVDERGGTREEDENMTTTLSNAASPSSISEDMLNLPGPQTNSSCMSQVTSIADSPVECADKAPLFKSRLLQSMIARGRLTNTISPGTCSEPLISDPAVARTRPHAKLPQTNGDVDPCGQAASQSRSYDSDISKSIIDCEQSRSGLSYESQIEDSHLTNGRHHSDTENELTLSSLNSVVDPVLLSPEMHLADCVVEALSDVSCSQLAADWPATVPSRVLELL